MTTSNSTSVKPLRVETTVSRSVRESDCLSCDDVPAFAWQRYPVPGSNFVGSGMSGVIMPAFARFAESAEILRSVREFQLRRLDRFAASGLRVHGGIEHAADQERSLDRIGRLARS